jgi:hypothetical protein
MASNQKYHLRKTEKAMPERADQLAVLHSQKFLTMALANEDEPYLTTMNYAFSEPENCFYVHCAPEGKKIDFLRRNPRFWGQVVQDRGYAAGDCSHNYRSVMFEGQVEFVETEPEMRRALELMIDQLEPEPQKVKGTLAGKLEGVAVLRLRVESMTGKQSPAPKKKN